METIEALLEETVEIEAEPARVWALVSDVARMSSWSPQVVRSFVRGRPVQLGTTFVNLNRRGPLVWPTQAKVVRCEPHRRVRLPDQGELDDLVLHPRAHGDRHPARPSAARPRTASPGSRKRLTRIALGGQATFTAELRAGMRQTLERVKAEAER